MNDVIYVDAFTRNALTEIAIEAMKERPGDLRLDHFSLIDTVLGLRYWVASGPRFLRVYVNGPITQSLDSVAIGPCYHVFPLFTLASLKFWWHFRKWKKDRVTIAEHNVLREIFNRIDTQ